MITVCFILSFLNPVPNHAKKARMSTATPMTAQKTVADLRTSKMLFPWFQDRMAPSIPNGVKAEHPSELVAR